MSRSALTWREVMNARVVRDTSCCLGGDVPVRVCCAITILTSYNIIITVYILYNCIIYKYYSRSVFDAIKFIMNDVIMTQ